MPRLERNPHRVGRLTHPFSVSRAPLEFHRRLPGYEPTPLVELPSVAKRLGVEKVFAKDESSRLGLPAFKMLGASWATYLALRERYRTRFSEDLEGWEGIEALAKRFEPLGPITLAAATDGNHGRAVARMAKLLGLGAHIFVPSDMAVPRIEAIRNEGAKLTIVDGDYDDAVRRSAGQASDTCMVISDTSWPGYGIVPRWIIEGYSTIFWEIEDHVTSFIPPFDLVAVPVGVGALAAAAVSHYRTKDDQPMILSVEPVDAACVMASVLAGDIVEVPGPHRSSMSGLNCGIASPLAFPTLKEGFDFCCAIEDEYAEQAMRALAKEGVVAGETGAAGLGALFAFPDIREHFGSVSSILLLVTEGATDPINYERVVGAAADG